MALSFIDPSFTPVIATFLFVFAVVFALLSYTRIFQRKDPRSGEPTGEEPRKVYALLAVVFGFFAAAYEPLVTGLQSYLPYASMILIVLFIILFLKKIVSGKEREKFDAFPVVLSLGVLLLVLGIFWETVAIFLPTDLTSANAFWIIGLLIIIAIFYAVHKHGPQGPHGGPATGGGGRPREEYSNSSVIQVAAKENFRAGRNVYIPYPIK